MGPLSAISGRATNIYDLAVPDASRARPAAATAPWRVRAPGRVNLIGDHTDYQDGLCVPAALDLAITMHVEPRTEPVLTVRSGGEVVSLELTGASSLVVATPSPEWAALVAATAAELTARDRTLRGAVIDIEADLPAGAGLASSAALCVGLALALDRGSAALEPLELARVAQSAEHRATGVPCGLLDQMACVFGTAGEAMLLDCRTLDVRPVPLGDLEFIIVDSGLVRRLAGSDYGRRRAACEAAAERLGVATLRDAALDEVGDDRFARHVVSENERVRRFVTAVERGDLGTIGETMSASHASLRDDFGVSTPELDGLVERLERAGGLGARLTGAGFGGCVVALVAPGCADQVVSDALAAGPSTSPPRRWWPVVAGPGAAIDGPGPGAAIEGPGPGAER